MTIPISDIEARKKATEDELVGMYGDDRIERRRTLTAELMVIDTYNVEIHHGQVESLETRMKDHANHGNLNFAAGLERIIKWMKSYDHV